jgi:hypothetical protein
MLFEQHGLKPVFREVAGRRQPSHAAADNNGVVRSFQGTDTPFRYFVFSLNNRPPAAECRGAPKARIQIGSLCDKRIYRKSFKKDSRGLATNHIILNSSEKHKRKKR